MTDPRPLIGLLCNRTEDDGVAADCLRSIYVQALAQGADVDCVLLPTNLTGCAANTLVARLDGVVLTGASSNVAPDRYGAAHAEPAQDIPRDISAFHLIAAACRVGTPLLGICRGLQEMNVACGGSLRPTPPSTDAHPDHHEDLTQCRAQQYAHKHHIQVQPGGLLATLLDHKTDLMVNSLHHQCIDHCALRIEARSADGVVEAGSIPAHGGFALGLQWHPEWFYQTDWLSQRLFRGFGTACRDHLEHKLQAQGARRVASHANV